MKTLTTNQVLDALIEVTGTLDSPRAPTRSANRAHAAAPDVDELDASERLVRTLAEAIDAVASHPDLPPVPLEDPFTPARTEVDSEKIPATRS